MAIGRKNRKIQKTTVNLNKLNLTGNIRPPNLKRKTKPKQCAEIDTKLFLADILHGILPELKEDIKNGLSAEEIFKKYTHLAAARTVSIVATSSDNRTALSAAKEVVDRAQGKAVEKKEVKHEFDKLSDKELDAMLESKMAELPKNEAEDLAEILKQKYGQQ